MEQVGDVRVECKVFVFYLLAPEGREVEDSFGLDKWEQLEDIASGTSEEDQLGLECQELLELRGNVSQARGGTLI